MEPSRVRVASRDVCAVPWCVCLWGCLGPLAPAQPAAQAHAARDAAYKTRLGYTFAIRSRRGARHQRRPGGDRGGGGTNKSAGRAEAAPRSAHTTTPRRNGHSRRAHTTVQGRGPRESGSRAPDGTHDHTATRRARGAHTTVQGMLHTCSFHPTPLTYQRGAWPRHPPAASVIGERLN